MRTLVLARERTLWASTFPSRRCVQGVWLAWGAAGALACSSACGKPEEQSTSTSPSPGPATRAADGPAAAAQVADGLSAAPAAGEPPSEAAVVLPPAGHRFSDAAVRVAREGATLAFTRDDGHTCRLEIAAIQYVRIHTTSEGPIYDDLFWELGGPEGGVCVVDGATPDVHGLMHALDELPGFARPEVSSVIIQATGSTNDATFDVWHRARGSH
jgi:hypothetical protein